MDNLSKCMIQCKKDGYGCHYGAWRAAQGEIVIDENALPEGWKRCLYCGDPFRPASKNHRYCGAYCQNRASLERCKQRKEANENGDIQL